MKKIKSDLIREVAAREGMSIRRVTRIVNTFLNVLIETIVQGHEIHLRRLGTFYTHIIKPKRVIAGFMNDKQVYVVGPLKAVKFYCARSLNIHLRAGSNV